MSGLEMTRSELVRTLVRAGGLMAGPRPLKSRLRSLCAGASVILGCDHINVLILEDNMYRPICSVGYSPDVAEAAAQIRVTRDRSAISTIEACSTYLLVHNAKEDELFGKAARALGFESVIIVPFTTSDGSPLGYLTADFVTNHREFTVEEAELTMGVARLAQSALLRDREIQRREQITKALGTVGFEERQRLIHELQDDPLQRVVSLRTGLEEFHNRVTDKSKQSAVAAFIDQCQDTLSSLSKVMVHSQPTEAELTDLEAVLRSTAAAARRGSELTLDFRDERTLDTPQYVHAALNRIAEQAVRNAVQHAHATQLLVKLVDETFGSSLSVIDNGIGFNPNDAPTGHLGVVSMRERAESLGGSFSVNSSRGAGTVIRVSLPHSPRQADR